MVPEGPEIHRAADRIRTALIERPTERVFFGLPHLAPLAEGFTGQRVTGVTAYGKAMLTAFEDGRSVFSHNQLYGRWFIMKAGSRPATNRSLRFLVENDQKAALLYSASTLEVLMPDDVPHHPFLSKLGPDPLQSGVGPGRVRAQLEDRRFKGRALSALLLDQAFVAGLGNYLRSEILFVAGLRPPLRPRDLDPDTVCALADIIVDVTRRAYKTGGITNDPIRVKALKARGVPRRRYRHWVFARGGQPCYRCDARIEQHTVGGRRLYQCPQCQP